MGQAKIYWELENYSMVEPGPHLPASTHCSSPALVMNPRACSALKLRPRTIQEKIFRQSAEFCSEDESWKLPIGCTSVACTVVLIETQGRDLEPRNVAHIFFMQEKFKECIRYYEPFVRKHNDDLLNVTAIILANLCVAYAPRCHIYRLHSDPWSPETAGTDALQGRQGSSHALPHWKHNEVMTSANEEAEELMRLVEREDRGGRQSSLCVGRPKSSLSDLPQYFQI